MYCAIDNRLEELIFGSEHVTQGAGSDFQQATSVAHSMVSHRICNRGTSTTTKQSVTIVGNKTGNE